MKKTILCLIRHGDVDNPTNMIYGRVRDVALSKKGVTQITDLAQRLKEKGDYPSLIYTSPLRRAIESAKCIQNVFGLEVAIVEDPDLLELDCPGLEKYSLEWLHSIGGDIYSYKGEELISIPIESPASQAKRVVGAIKRAVSKHRGKTICMVSHGDPTSFAKWSLVHDGKVPHYNQIMVKKGDYLKKAEAWELVFDTKGNVSDVEYIPRKG